MALATTGASSMAVVNGDLEIQDATLNINSLAGFGTGNYELIAFTTVGSDNLSLGSGTSSDFNYLIVDEANSIWLDVTPAAVTPVGPFTWTGANGSAWDINATQNWSNASGASKYADGYAVTFDDMAGAGHGTVSIAGTVEPTSILVNNSSLAYTFSGAGSIADNIAGPTSLTKSGNGSLEINMAGNTYSGGTFLTAGLLQLDANSTVTSGTLAGGPVGVGPVTLSGGTLQDNGSGVTLANAVNVTGNVTLAGLTFGPQGLSTPNTVTITGAPTITVTSPVTVADQVSGTLVKAGFEYADPDRGGQQSRRYDAGQRRHVGGHGGQHRHAGGAFQQRQCDLQPGGPWHPESGGQRQRLADCGGHCCAGRHLQQHLHRCDDDQ